VGIAPHLPAAALAVAEAEPAAELVELDEPDEQAARPRPAARARAAMPLLCTALIDVSFDTVNDLELLYRNLTPAVR
jgi:hypothetical protein